MEHLQHQIIEELEFLKAFSKIGLESLFSLKGLRMYASSREDLARDYLDEIHIGLNSTLDGYLFEVYEPRQVEEKRTIIALDTSSVRLAESSNGVIISIKGAIVVRDKDNSISIQTLGPFLFNLNKINFKNILREYSELVQCSSGYDFYLNAQRALTELLERRMQEHIVEKSRDSIILFDGCLVANNFNHYKNVLEKILRIAEENGNVVIAFSKTSFIQVSGAYLQSIYIEQEPPYIIDLTTALKHYCNYEVRTLGRICLARLIAGSPGYRVDVPIKSDIPTFFGLLLKSDPLIYGYPETLILAHDYSTFTRLDIITLQTILKKMDVELLYPQYVRDILFQPLDGDYR
jgi:hypothetical protein